MGQAVPEDDLPGAVSNKAVPANDLPGAVDNSKYQDHPISTFAAQAINSLTFGLPDYLNKTFTPDTYAETQKYVNANPLAANTGDIAGTVAGYAIPVGAGIRAGANIGARGAEMAVKKFAPEIATGQYAPLAKLYGRFTGATTGGTMGAQTAAALPGLVQGNPGQAVASAEMVNQYANQIPGASPLGGVTGHIIPGIIGVGGEAYNATKQAIAEKNKQDRIKMQMQYEAAKRVLGIQ
jgi:hypothetical protein